MQKLSDKDIIILKEKIGDELRDVILQISTLHKRAQKLWMSFNYHYMEVEDE